MQSKGEHSSLPVIFTSPSNSGSNFRYRSIKRKLQSSGRQRRILVSFLCIGLTFYLLTNLYIFRDLLYVLRPLFDHETDFTRLPHFYDPSLNANELCDIHGWKARPQKARVIDVVIFSLEFDILELRLRELWNSVDVFVVIEADRTFSGAPKEFWLEKNLKQFQFAKSKLKHHRLVNVLQELKEGDSPFYNENLQRHSVTEIVSRYAKNGDLIILSDVDEIPRSSTVDLIKSCDHVPDPIHLQLRTYFYSFEFYFSLNDSWRAKIQAYNQETFLYNHSQKSKFLLADSGWHCTFCFRFIKDFRFKMLSYSHNDRLMGRKELLESAEIQRRICNGLEIFDMFPEVYSFREMVQKFGAIPSSKSLIDLPKGLISNSKRFGYLLPGNCVREDSDGGGKFS